MFLFLDNAVVIIINTIGGRTWLLKVIYVLLHSLTTDPQRFVYW